jgi:hypothetical protein
VEEGNNDPTVGVRCYLCALLEKGRVEGVLVPLGERILTFFGNVDLAQSMGKLKGSTELLKMGQMDALQDSAVDSWLIVDDEEVYVAHRYL